MDLDLAFLDVAPRPVPVRTRPVNVYEILREGWRETRVDMTLQFFLDPNERHGLGPLVIDALLRLLDGAPVIGEGGKTGDPFSAQDYVGSDSWEIRTQARNIDVLAVNRDRGIAIVLENKIGHVLDNPLGGYASHALSDKDVNEVLVAVLAPEVRLPNEDQEPWLSRAVTYSELADGIKGSPGFVDQVLDPAGRNERRSLDLLQQFIEARSGDEVMNDLDAEAARLGDWRTVIADHEDAIQRFDESRKKVAQMLRERASRLVQPIYDRLGGLSITPEQQWSGAARSDDESWSVFTFAPQNWWVGSSFLPSQIARSSTSTTTTESTNSRVLSHSVLSGVRPMKRS